jgi:hypothetical protein
MSRPLPAEEVGHCEGGGETGLLNTSIVNGAFTHVAYARPMLTNLLIYRFVLVNTLFFALTASLWWNGFLAPIFETDLSRLTVAIAGLFALGWLGMAREIVIASRQLNNAKSALQPAREAERDKDLAKVEWLGSVSEWLVGLGLIGTVVGFIMALSSVDQSALVQSSGAQSAVATLMTGMRIALNTTVLGASLAIWHEVNQRMLRTALAVYWADRLAAVP